MSVFAVDLNHVYALEIIIRSELLKLFQSTSATLLFISEGWVVPESLQFLQDIHFILNYWAIDNSNNVI